MRIAGLAALCALVIASASLAQQRPAPPPSPQAASPSTRTEILTFDSWAVTCRDATEPSGKRACTAELQIVQAAANNQNAVVFSWLAGLNPSGAPVSVLRFPSGVLIAPGVELKLSAKEPRKIPFTSCEPARCEAAIVMDDAFIREAAATQTAEATIYASDGRGVKFTINMKGFQQALAIVRK